MTTAVVHKTNLTYTLVIISRSHVTLYVAVILD